MEENEIKDEKEEILFSYDEEIKKDKNISFYELTKTYIFVTLFFLFTIPAIYIRNEIYYISRDITELKTKHDVLMEENRNLNNNMEFLRYKNQIIDPLSIENGQ